VIPECECFWSKWVRIRLYFS